LHSPPWNIHHRRNESVRAAAPSLTPRNWAATIAGNGAVIPTHDKAAASGKDILKRVSAISADLQQSPVEA
jgi:hypothetical protein